MDGDKQKKPKGKPSSGWEKGELAEETRSGEVNNGEASPSMLAIYDEIRALRSDLKSEMSEFRLSFRDDMKKELNEFKGEINKKLQETTKELAATTARVEEAEQRIAEIEEWDTEVKEALALMMESQETLRAKLTELEARSRRNNLRIHGVPEGSEGPDLIEFVTKLIRAQIGPPVAETNLGIQRCHRALAPKPQEGAPPRSLVLCFLEYRIKEMVLHSAWRKKDVRYDGKRLYFDQDYPPDILRKRKAYVGILRVLKAKGLRFQTPHPAKLRVFFDSGTKLYENATEAAEDLKKRGFCLDEIKEPGPTAPKQQRAATWERAGADRSRKAVDRRRIREKLRSFHRAPPVTSDSCE